MKCVQALNKLKPHSSRVWWLQQASSSEISCMEKKNSRYSTVYHFVLVSFWMLRQTAAQDTLRKALSAPLLHLPASQEAHDCRCSDWRRRKQHPPSNRDPTAVCTLSDSQHRLLYSREYWKRGRFFFFSSSGVLKAQDHLWRSPRILLVEGKRINLLYERASSLPFGGKSTFQQTPMVLSDGSSFGSTGNFTSSYPSTKSVIYSAIEDIPRHNQSGLAFQYSWKWYIKTHPSWCAELLEYSVAAYNNINNSLFKPVYLRLWVFTKP